VKIERDATHKKDEAIERGGTVVIVELDFFGITFRHPGCLHGSTSSQL
jgi:hypothetical protein